MSDTDDCVHVSGSINGNFHCSWTVPRFSTLNFAVGKKTESRNFQLDVYQPRWHIKLYPGGKFTDDAGYVSCYLSSSVDGDQRSRMLVKIQLFTFRNSAGKELWHYECGKEVVKGDPGCARVIERDTLIEKLVGDVLIISVCVTYGNTCVMNGGIAEYSTEVTPNMQLVENYELLSANAETADVTLSVGGEKIPVHSVILRSRSKIFDEMFRNDARLKDGQSVEIADLGKDVVDSFLQFVYTGNIVVMNIEKALELLRAAAKYEMKDLELFISNYLISQLNDKNVATVLIDADKYKADKLRAKAIEYFEGDGMRDMLFKHRSVLESRGDLLYEIFEYMGSSFETFP